jgi:chemotaxis protein MotA
LTGIIEAILLIQEEVNPNTLSEKLKGFLNKQDLLKENLDLRLTIIQKRAGQAIEE